VLDAVTAAAQLGVSKSHLYRLRTARLAGRSRYLPKASGGNHRSLWPGRVHTFLEGFLPIQDPPNYQLVADELERLCNFVRARSSVEAYIKLHFSHLAPIPRRKQRVHRRFRRAKIGELWQHDSSVHQWWPAPRKQTLLLTIDDHSGLNLAGRFVTSDTTWNHFCHFREAFERYGIPEIVYTDGLSLFGPSSDDDRSDPKSQFQRALRSLGVAHLVAPTPQAKGKVERRFGTFQRRLLTLMAHAQVKSWKDADEILQMEIRRQNNKLSRSTGKVPAEVWLQAIQKDQISSMRPCPPSALLDLHLSLRASRRVNNDHTIDFEGSSYQISATKSKHVTIVHHPNSKFWVVEHTPKGVWPIVLAAYTL
jgi:hypothetical protein